MFRRRSTRALRQGLVAGSALLTAAPPTLATDWYVDVQHPQCATGTGGPADPFCDIADALAVAAAGDTIFVAPGTYLEALLVDRDLSFVGTGGAAVTFWTAVLPAFRALDVAAGVEVTADGFTLAGPSDGLRTNPGSVMTLTSSTVSSGGITTTGADLTLDSVTVDGQINANYGGTLTVTCSTLTGPGDGIFSVYTPVTITNSSLSGNTLSGVCVYGTSLVVSDCTVFGNLRTGISVLDFGSTGTITNTTVSGNDAGIVAYLSTVTASHCTISGNGSGVQGFCGNLSLESCAILGNSSTTRGGGISASDSLLALDSCTVAGNTASSEGGIFAPDFPVELSHTVVAGNTAAAGAPDCGGTVQSLGYNLIGDTTGCVVGGDPTGNQLDVDPLFQDAPGGDFSLSLASPAVDAGDPARVFCGSDVDGNQRVLDGDLDRVMVQDLGAYEFHHVRASLGGDATPGGTLSLDVTGTAGAFTFLWLGLAPGETLFPPFGCLGVNLAVASWVLLPLGTLPLPTLMGTLDPGLPAGTTFVFQAHALLGRSGNLSNVEIATLE